MVGRFVEDQIIGIVDEQMRERGLRALAARKGLERTFKIPGFEAEGGEHDAQALARAARLFMRHSRDGRVDQLLQRRLRLVRDALREIAEFRVASAHDRSTERRIDACEQPQQRRFAGTVRPYETDTLAFMQDAAEIREDLARAVMALELREPDQFHWGTRNAGGHVSWWTGVSINEAGAGKSPTCAVGIVIQNWVSTVCPRAFFSHCS